MQHHRRIRRLFAAGSIVLAGVLGPLAPAARAATTEPDVPIRIAVPDGNKVFLVGHATGVQIYECTVTSTGLAWNLVAPRADLYDDKGRLVATHFGGPTWRATDGSTVKAQRVDGVTVDADAIQWLLLAKVSTTVGADGDRLTNTSYIQRINTTGGLAPAATTCYDDVVGDVVEVPYTADYWFWKPSGS